MGLAKWLLCQVKLAVNTAISPAAPGCSKALAGTNRGLSFPEREATFLLTIIFRYIPMGGVLIAFENYNPFAGITGSEWVGFYHFERFLTSPDFLSYLVNTLKLSVFGLLWGFPAPIILAFLLNRIISKSRKQKIQLVLYMPNFISVIVLCGIVRILLSPTGMLNMLLGTNYNFMTMPQAFRTIYIASGIWQGAGWGSIIYTEAIS